MKRLLMILLILGVVLAAVQAVETAQPEENEFITELTSQLRQRGWDKEDLGLLREQARLLDWKQTRMADPAMVAYALHYGTYNEGDHSPQTARLRAQLALQLALETRELEQLGYGFQTIAQGAARGIRDVTAQVRNQSMKQDRISMDPALGNMVRNAVRSEVLQQQKNVNQNAFKGGQGFRVKSGQAMNGSGHRPGSHAGARR